MASKPMGAQVFVATSGVYARRFGLAASYVTGLDSLLGRGIRGLGDIMAAEKTAQAYVEGVDDMRAKKMEPDDYQRKQMVSPVAPLGDRAAEVVIEDAIRMAKRIIEILEGRL